MNVLAQFFGVALNVLMSPFSPEAPQIAQLTGEPCVASTIKMGENEMKVSLAPKGHCPNCCAVKSSSDIRFMFYSYDNPQHGVQIEPIRAGVAKAKGINASWPTVIFIHGFTEPSPGQSGRTIADAYLNRTTNRHNVLLLDWSSLSAFPWYKPAVRNVKWVSEKLRNFLEVFNDSGEIPIGGIHLIGFSLGSHIAGFAGKRLRAGLRIPRITALDPAFPEYSIQDPSRRLTRSDADYIDVIHTDAGVLGLPNAVGHADFYPNGGRALQPGCQPSYLVQIRLIDQILACSHVRAWRLYAESVIEPNVFPATHCPLWRGPNKNCNFKQDGVMGYGNNNKSRGQFYLFTNFKAPFGRSMVKQIDD